VSQVTLAQGGGVETESCESTGLSIAGAAGISCGADGTSSFEESRTNIRINAPIEDELFAATLREHATWHFLLQTKVKSNEILLLH
jgi:hypothetical protein